MLINPPPQTDWHSAPRFQKASLFPQALPGEVWHCPRARRQCARGWGRRGFCFPRLHAGILLASGGSKNDPVRSKLDPVRSKNYPADRQTYPAGYKTYPAGYKTYPVDDRTYPASYKTYPANDRTYPARSLRGQFCSSRNHFSFAGKQFLPPRLSVGGRKNPFGHTACE